MQTGFRARTSAEFRDVQDETWRAQRDFAREHRERVREQIRDQMRSWRYTY